MGVREPTAPPPGPRPAPSPPPPPKQDKVHRAGWSKQQVRHFVKAAKADWGPGWDRLGPRLQETVILAAAARVVLGQCDSTLDTAAVRSVDTLIRHMLVHAGLWTADAVVHCPIPKD